MANGGQDRVYMYIYIHVFIRTYMHACMHAYIHTCTYTQGTQWGDSMRADKTDGTVWQQGPPVTLWGRFFLYILFILGICSFYFIWWAAGNAVGQVSFIHFVYFSFFFILCSLRGPPVRLWGRFFCCFQN